MRLFLPKTYLLICLLAVSGLMLLPQLGWSQVIPGIELQVYPTGIMPGLRVEKRMNRNEVNLRLGLNLFDHRDLGVQEEEIGGGGGGSLGYRRYFADGGTGFFLGARTDLWVNRNRWRDEIGTPTEVSGTTNLLVVQPTAEAGYRLGLGESRWLLAPTLGFGFEVNVVSDGADVGQGAIVLLGVSLMAGKKP
jgi:hypothetical protein